MARAWCKCKKDSTRSIENGDPIKVWRWISGSTYRLKNYELMMKKALNKVRECELPNFRKKKNASFLTRSTRRFFVLQIRAVTRPAIGRRGVCHRVARPHRVQRPQWQRHLVVKRSPRWRGLVFRSDPRMRNRSTRCCLLIQGRWRTRATAE